MFNFAKYVLFCTNLQNVAFNLKIIQTTCYPNLKEKVVLTRKTQASHNRIQLQLKIQPFSTTKPSKGLRDTSNRCHSGQTRWTLGGHISGITLITFLWVFQLTC